jgi:RHS repeat-associated protein
MNGVGDMANNWAPLLTSVSNGYNGTVSYAYQIVKPGTSYEDEWGPTKSQSQVTLPQVSSRTVDPSSTLGGSTPVAQTYSYGTPRGNSNADEPEFRGYDHVTMTEDNKTVEHDFLQGLNTTWITLLDPSVPPYLDVTQMQGLEWRTITKQWSNILDVGEKAFTTYSGSGTPSGSLAVGVQTDEDNRYPLNTTSLSPVPSGNMRRTTTYTYDSYGNVQHQYDYLGGANGTLQRSSQTGYSLNPSLWIVNTVWYRNVFDGAGNLISNDGYYYDTPPGGVDYDPFIDETNPATPTAGHVSMYRRMIRDDSQYDSISPCLSCTRTYYTYDSYGNRLTVQDPNGNVTRTGWDATETFPITVTYPIVGYVTATWDSGLGKPTSSTDLNGQVTHYKYDAFGRLTQLAKAGDMLDSAPTVKYDYTDPPTTCCGRSVPYGITTTRRLSGTANEVEADYYDGVGRLYETKTTDENGKYVVVFQNYDGNGRLLQRSNPTEISVSGPDVPIWSSLTSTTYGYDGLDRPTSVQSPSTGLTTTTYSGWTSEVVDANNHCRLFNDDFAVRVSQATIFDGTYNSFGASGCGVAHTTAYNYNPNDKLTLVTDAAGNQTSITYDDLGRKTRISDPDMGTWSYGYDANGNLTTQIDARGQVSFYTYDGINRLTGIATATPTVISAATINAIRTQINIDRTNNSVNNSLPPWGWVYPAGSLSTSNDVSAATFNEMVSALQGIGTYHLPPTFTLGPISGGTRPIRIADLIDLNLWAYGNYTPPTFTPLIQYTYDQSWGGFSQGHRTTMQDQSGTTTYIYDNRGRINSETRNQGSNNYTTQYAYNDADQVTTLTYPGSGAEIVTTGYNIRGLPQSVVGSSSYVSGTTPVVYDLLGRPTTITFGDGSTNVSTYDGTTTRLTSFTAPGIARSYGYDAIGNLTCLNPASVVICNTTTSGVAKFIFDAENRLTSMGNTGITDPDSYSFDTQGLGELTAKTEGATGHSLSYTSARPAHAPKTVDGATYTYDATGNLIGRGATSYIYDWQNHLVQANQNGSPTQFAYDGDGNLAQRIDPTGTITDYIGDIYDKAIPTGTATPTETKRYYLGDTLVATNVGGTVSYTHQDYLHSTVSTNSTTTAEYTPYGQVRTYSGTLPTDRQFQGQQNQSSVGLYHMGARWYDPTIGLWTQPDNVVPNSSDPLSLNRYSFVEGNPLKRRDPSGHWDDDIDEDAVRGGPPPGAVFDGASGSSSPTSSLDVNQADASVNVEGSSIPTRISVLRLVSPDTLRRVGSTSRSLRDLASYAYRQAVGQMGEEGMTALATQRGYTIAQGFVKRVHGFDAVYEQNGQLIIGESKSMGSQLRVGQLSPEWIASNAKDMVENGESDAERELGRKILQQLQQGTLRRELYRTTIDVANKDIWTTVEDSGYVQLDVGTQDQSSGSGN